MLNDCPYTPFMHKEAEAFGDFRNVTLQFKPQISRKNSISARPVVFLNCKMHRAQSEGFETCICLQMIVFPKGGTRILLVLSSEWM